jgi:superfamily II DNA or RNA helicase
MGVGYQKLEFQTTAVATVVALFSSARSVLMQSATGSGKTVMAAMFLKDYLTDPQHRVLAIVNSQPLVSQMHDTITDHGVSVSVLHDKITHNKAGLKLTLDYSRQVLVTMPRTFINTRAGVNQLKWDPLFEPTLILFDEAHKATSEDFQIIRDTYPRAQILGLTATPYREKNKEGESIVEWYGNNVVFTVSVRELINMGRLVAPRYRILGPEHHVVNEWKTATQHSANKRTIVFTRDTHHSVALEKAFRAAGVVARIITSGSEVDPHCVIPPQTPAQRQAIYNDFEAGAVQVLLSVNALCEGFDCPAAKFCFLVRVVGNHALYHQMIGRVLRAFKDKTHAVIVDFHGNFQVHGDIVDYQWSVEDTLPNNAFVQHGDKISRESYLKKSHVYHVCSCHHVYDIKKHRVCNECQHPHGVQLGVKVQDMLEAVGVFSSKDREKFQARFNPALTDARYHDVVNKKFAAIFQDGELRSEYSFLLAIQDMGYRDTYYQAA